jgi:hypothetical protein
VKGRCPAGTGTGSRNAFLEQVLAGHERADLYRTVQQEITVAVTSDPKARRPVGSLLETLEIALAQQLKEALCSGHGTSILA